MSLSETFLKINKLEGEAYITLSYIYKVPFGKNS